MKRKAVSTRRLHIRPLKPSDYAAWLEAYTNGLPKKTQYDLDPRPLESCTREAYKKQLSRYDELASQDKLYIWGVFKKSSNELVGLLDISIISRRWLQVANLGYRIFNRHWKQGYATEFVKAVIPHALTTLKLNRLEAVIDLTNRPSIRLAKAAGMKREGIRESYYYESKGEVWQDQVVFSSHRKQLGLPTLIVRE